MKYSTANQNGSWPTQGGSAAKQEQNEPSVVFGTILRLDLNVYPIDCVVIYREEKVLDTVSVNVTGLSSQSEVGRWFL